jgi:hypothetical protein
VKDKNENCTKDLGSITLMGNTEVRKIALWLLSGNMLSREVYFNLPSDR